MSKIRKYLMAFALALVGGSTYAADGDVFDFAVVNTNMTSLKNALVTWSTAFTPILLAIVGAFIVYWLFKFALRIAKSMSNAAK